ncbi:MAG: hypothetical protein U1F43_37725 [Myxococcota bacterium]
MQGFQVPFIEPREVAVTVEQWSTAEARAAVPEGARPSFELVLTSGGALVKKLSRVAREGPAADVVFDNRFGGLFDMLAGLARFGRGAGFLALEPALAERVSLAQLLLAGFFGPDMKWLNLPYIDEWREGRYRLMRLDDAGVDGRPSLREAFTKLGLGLELGATSAGHQRLAEVLGITDGASGDLSDDVDAWNRTVADFLVALRHHAGRATDDPTSEVGKRLVRPVEDAWARQRERRKGKAGSTGAGGGTPEVGTTP